MIWYSRDENGVEVPLTVSGGQTIQVNEMPAASSDYVGIVCQYIGETTVNYTHNYFYECIEDTSTNPATYSWVPTNVQAGDGSSVQADWNQADSSADDYIKNKPTIPGAIQYSTMPTASAELIGTIVQYTGATDSNYTHGYFYECRSYFKGVTIYYWGFIDVADVDNKIDNKLNSKLSEKQNKIIQSNVFTLSRNSWTKNSQGIYEQTITVNVNWTVNSTHYKNIINVPNNYINSWSLYGIKIKNYLLSTWTTSSPTGSESSGENINTITFSCKREPTSDFTFTITSIDIGSKGSELIYSITDTSNFTIEGLNYNFISGGPSITLTTNIEDSANGYIQRIYINGHSEDVNDGIVAVGDVASGKIKSVGDAGWGVVDLGTLTWTKVENKAYFIASGIPTSSNETSDDVGLCSKYNIVPLIDIYREESADKSIGVADTRIYALDTTYTDATAFKSAMSGVLLYYPLADATGATPILGITSKNGEGQGTAATITTGLPLRSVSDSIYDTLDNEKVTKKCAEVDLGTLTYTYTSSDGQPCFQTQISGIKRSESATTYPYVFSAMYDKEIWNKNRTDATADMTIAVAAWSDFISIRNSNYTDATAFKSAMSGVKLVYELATPTEIPLTSAEKSALASLRTYNSNTQLDVTNAHAFDIHYLRNTGNGQAVADIQTDLQEQIDDKTDKVTSAISGNFAGLDENGNLTDSGKKATDFATASDMTAVQGVIPSTATTQNKLATASDVTGEDISSTSTTSPLTDSADGFVQGVTVKGKSRKTKNLLEITATTTTKDGITFTVNNDGTIKVTGTATALTYLEINNLYDDGLIDNVTYILNGCPTGGDTGGFKYRLDFGLNVFSDYGEGVEFTTTDYTSSAHNVRIVIFNGYACPSGGLIFKPMICTAADYAADPTFEPYFEGIKSIGDAGWGVVDLGTLTWTYESEYSYIQRFASSAIPNIKLPNTQDDIPNLICRYKPRANGTDGLGYWMPYSITCGYGGYRRVDLLVPKDITTVEQLMNYIGNNNLLYYPLADASQADSLLGITSKNGAGQGTAATITTGLPLRSVSDSIYDTLDNEKVVKKCAGGKVNDTNIWSWSKSTTLSNENRTVFYVTKTDCSYPANQTTLPTFIMSGGFETQTQDETWTPNHISCEANAHYICVVVSPTITTVEAFLTAYGNEEIYYPLATPTETPLTSAEKSSLASLRTYDHTTHIDATDAPTMTVDYLLNTDNGQAVANIQTDLQGQIDDTGWKLLTLASGITTINVYPEDLPRIRKIGNVVYIRGQVDYSSLPSSGGSIATSPIVPTGERGMYPTYNYLAPMINNTSTPTDAVERDIVLINVNDQLTLSCAGGLNSGTFPTSGYGSQATISLDTTICLYPHS